MKSCRVFLIALFSFIYISLNVLVFVGGSVRFNTFNHEDNGTTTTQKTSNYNLDLSPSVGVFLSKKLAIGLALRASLTGIKTYVITETISKSSTFGISPFMRYYALKWNKFSVYGQGNIIIDFSNSSVETGGITTDGPKRTIASLSFYPGLSYDISEKLSLQTSLNILSFGYYYSIANDGSSKDNSSSFNFGAGLDDIISVGVITIGGIYKF